MQDQILIVDDHQPVCKSLSEVLRRAGYEAHMANNGFEALEAIRQEQFEVRIDHDFQSVIDGCAQSRPGRHSTWINQRIRSLYGELFGLGHCHTVEVWCDGDLMGGLYGVRLAGAFFGESMFSRERDASKVALVYLAARLKYGGFTLLDTQFLVRFGAIEVSREKFQRLLDDALLGGGDFSRLPADCSGDSVLQLVSQTSKTGCSTA